jgi:F0F1-type ATP synthase delta subunit
MVFSVDEKAMGGVRVKIGDQVYDGTLKTRLKDLHSLLVK